ncbi:MAG: sigma-70 family RNA polymerase sigma factor [Patescibacteria group bacterium]|nr:sigma-70 family RNA polymerase sigma factor [Patescibacteria group bacterium]
MVRRNPRHAKARPHQPLSVHSGSPCDEMPLVVTESSTRRALSDPDVRLMLEVRDGSAVAFEQLVARYQDRLVTVLDHVVGNRDQAEDLAQEVFLRVYRSRKNYEPGAKFATWLFTIANNTALNALRSRARRREVHLTAPDSGAFRGQPMDRVLHASSSQMPARQFDKAELRSVVRIALESLNERQRMAVLLSKFEDMSYADIAQAMELTPQAIKSLLARARVNLREVLAPYLEEGRRPGVPHNE